MKSKGAEDKRFPALFLFIRRHNGVSSTGNCMDDTPILFEEEKVVLTLTQKENQIMK